MLEGRFTKALIPPKNTANSPKIEQNGFLYTIRQTQLKRRPKAPKTGAFLCDLGGDKKAKKRLFTVPLLYQYCNNLHFFAIKIAVSEVLMLQKVVKSAIFGVFFGVNEKDCSNPD